MSLFNDTRLEMKLVETEEAQVSSPNSISLSEVSRSRLSPVFPSVRVEGPRSALLSVIVLLLLGNAQDGKVLHCSDKTTSSPQTHQTVTASRDHNAYF